MFKKIFTTFVLALSLTQIAYPLILSAQTEYTVLAPLPGTYKGGNKTDIKTYVEGMFKLLIALSAVFAVFMIVIGGFQYMTTDAIGGKQEGRDRIENSIKGLILVIGAWLILVQIDDRLLTINLDIKAANVPAPSGGGGGGGLSTTGLQQTTQTALNALKSQCPGCVRETSTTGGQHTTNSAHYQGRAVDLAANTQLTNFITGQNQNPASCARFTKTLNGVSSTFLWEPTGATCGGTVPSSGDHWHMSVPE